MAARTCIKICGVSREADVDAAVESGADAVGFVFYPQSPRHVTMARAAELARRLPPFVSAVGLFVNAGPSAVAAATDAVPGLVLQFHGDEAPGYCAGFRRPYLKAARMAPGVDLLDFCARYADARALLVDAPVEGYGGGGKVFDWSLVPAAVPLPVVLSGGLHAGNVIDGILQVRPWAVDVSSGVERSRGEKDPAAIRRFCEAVREADARRAAAEA
jgi:phosphoribosylanthranilate isomerase